jgi:hypothetical protein
MIGTPFLKIDLSYVQDKGVTPKSHDPGEGFRPIPERGKLSPYEWRGEVLFTS